MKIQTSLTLLILSFTGASHATPVAFSTEVDWQNALGATAVIQVEDFESSPVGTYSPGPSDIGLFSVQTDTNDPTAAIDDNTIAEPGFVNGSRDFQAFIIQDGIGGERPDTSFVDFIFESPLLGFTGDFFPRPRGIF